MQQHYDLLYIIPGTKAEDEVPALVTQVHEMIKNGGGTIVKNDFWGKRKLAYEIDHIRYGYYDAVDFDIDPAQLAALEQSMRLNALILRFQITKRKVLTTEQLAAAAQLRERIAAKREVAKEKEAVAMIKDEPIDEPAVAAPTAAPLEAKQLDEKLEELLESDKVEL